MMEGSDEQLVAKAVASGDTAAFEELVRRHQSRVRNWLRHLTRDAAQADDLAQDTFIRAWHRLGSFHGRGKFSSWLMKIAYNNFLQSVRKRKRDQRLVDELKSDEIMTAKPEDESALLDLPKMLSVLTVDERVSMTLCYAYGFSHGDIAEVTEMPLGTVKSHLRRGKAKIRERFDLVTESE